MTIYISLWILTNIVWLKQISEKLKLEISYKFSKILKCHHKKTIYNSKILIEKFMKKF